MDRSLAWKTLHGKRFTNISTDISGQTHVVCLYMIVCVVCVFVCGCEVLGMCVCVCSDLLISCRQINGRLRAAPTRRERTLSHTPKTHRSLTTAEPHVIAYHTALPIHSNTPGMNRANTQRPHPCPPPPPTAKLSTNGPGPER